MSEQLEVQAKSGLQEAMDFEVTVSTYQLACNRLSELKDLRIQIIEYWKKKKDADYRAWKMTCELEQAMLTPVEQAESLYNAKIVRMRAEEVRARKAEEARLQAIEEEKARKERERLEKQAAKAEAKGKVEEAEAIREAAPLIQAPQIVLPELAKPRDLTARKEWKIEVEDLGALVAAAAKEARFLTMLKPDLTVIARIVRATRGGDVPPGVRAWQEESFARKSRGGIHFHLAKGTEGGTEDEW